MAPGLANAVLVQHLVLGGVQPDLLIYFGGLLEKHLFLGRTLLLRLQGYQTCAGAGMLVPGLANAVLAQHFVLGMFADLISSFRWPTKKAFVLRTDAAFAAPGLPNLCWCRDAGSRPSKRCAGAAFRARRFAYLLRDFGSLLEKHLFLGRTLLLRLQGYQTCAGAGMLAPGLANGALVQHLVLRGVRPQGYQNCAGAGMLAPGLANAVLVQHLVLGGVCGP